MEPSEPGQPLAKKPKVEVDIKDDIAEDWEKIDREDQERGAQTEDVKRDKDGLLPSQSVEQETAKDLEAQNKLTKDW